jgi:hypothetical protein
MAVTGSSGTVVILRAERGVGPGFFGFFSGVAGFINFFNQNPISNFEFQTSLCLKFLLLQTQVFAKRASTCLDGLILQHRYCKANFCFFLS